MATLNQLLGVKIGHEEVILAGAPELTAILDSEDKPYYVARTLKPVMARCSMDATLEGLEVDEVYLREADAVGDKWAFVDEKDPSKGVYLPGYIVDFSKSHNMVLLQSESIRKWVKGNRGLKKEERDSNTRNLIRELMSKRGK